MFIIQTEKHSLPHEALNTVLGGLLEFLLSYDICGIRHCRSPNKSLNALLASPVV